MQDGPPTEVLAVVPTYRPPLAVLSLIAALRDEAIPVVVVDDASPCTSDRLLAEASRMPGVSVIRNTRNAGIARSLNQGLELARSTGPARSGRSDLPSGATWLLTVDQDSMLPSGYLSTLLAAATSPRIGVIGPQTIGDVSGDLTYPTWSAAGLLLTHEVFQTGALWSVAAMTRVGGFDERLGMDGVDAAACLRLREAGHLVALAPGLTLAHQVGRGRQVNLLGRSVMVSHHSPERRFTILRNRLRLAPAEFRQSPVHAFRTLRRVAVQSVLSVTVEDQRGAKVGALLRALSPLTRHPDSHLKDRV